MKLPASSWILSAIAALIIWSIPCQATAQAMFSSATDSITARDAVIPRPLSTTPGGGQFTLTPGARIVCRTAGVEVESIAVYLAGRLLPATGYSLPTVMPPDTGAPGDILLTVTPQDSSLGEEGYALRVSPSQVSLSAHLPAGLFHGVQTLRQLFLPAIERPTLQAGPWTIQSCDIRDVPRFPWRGVMLDVSRHFFGVDQVKRVIDLAAYYKLSRLHLHLADDQGWRIEIKSWPRLTTVGGALGISGTVAGWYTQEQYTEIVRYAASRYMTVVPEIDMPGHSYAALVSYPELTCNGVVPPFNGVSTLCTSRETTYTIIHDVLRELSTLTPGPYIHIGGDEAAATPLADYRTFIARVESLVTAQGKRMIGWEDIAQAGVSPSSIAQHWHTGQAESLAAVAVRKGLQVVMSPASFAYLDQKYNSTTRLGLSWAGYIEVDKAYAWDPATETAGVGEGNIRGVEGPLWTETIQTTADIEYMMYPRLIGQAEIGWSPATGRSWDEYKARLGTHGPRLTALGVNYYKSPLVPWIAEPAVFVRLEPGSSSATSPRLEQNFPNPFNPSTTIRYSLPHRSHVQVAIFNTLGQRVSTLVNAEVEAGAWEVKFDGSALASGAYLCRLEAEGLIQTRALLLIR